MKEMSATENSAPLPTDEQPAVEAQPEKTEVQKSPVKKTGLAARKPIRPRITRPPAAAAKTDAFEVEFAFDPNEDPFKPKIKLGASPPRDQIESPSDATISLVLVYWIF